MLSERLDTERARRDGLPLFLLRRKHQHSTPIRTATITTATTTTAAIVDVAAADLLVTTTQAPSVRADPSLHTHTGPNIAAEFGGHPS